jgi:bifunctional enzyme CysN/CysC
LASERLLRLLTCGSVDDGKSTLIGRLLLDSKSLFDDQLIAVRKASERYGTRGDDLDLALVLDGLDAEREQGITIDVAYRFFSTQSRSFIIADTPGHEQYTRNMATGASTADLAIILVDARKGILTQTRRHSYICSLLGIKSVVLAINKMDLVGYSSAVFESWVSEYQAFAKRLGFDLVMPIPICARDGDNIVRRSDAMSWYQGPTLLAHLETQPSVDAKPDGPLRFPVQLVNRLDADARGYAGTIVSGSMAVGDPIIVAGSGQKSSVARIVTFDGDRKLAQAGDAITLVLGNDVDVTRGDLIVGEQRRPSVADQFACHLIWLDAEPMLPGRSYLLKCGKATLPARVSKIKHRIDVNTLDERPARTLALNEIGICNVATSGNLAFDSYADNRATGSFILIDRFTNNTVGAGMIAFPLRRAHNIHHEHHVVSKAQRAAQKAQKPMILWFTGLSGAGKSTIANLVEASLQASGHHTFTLDGDNVRHGLNRDLSFTDADRVENIRRVSEVAKLMLDAGLIVICTFISPFRAERDGLRDMVEPGEFVEIFIDTSLEECMQRDVKGLYRAALAGEILNFTGLNSPYEAPLNPDLLIQSSETAAEAAARITAYVRSAQ